MGLCGYDINELSALGDDDLANFFAAGKASDVFFGKSKLFELFFVGD